MIIIKNAITNHFNGNYMVKILEDGTKERNFHIEAEEEDIKNNNYLPDFPESIDLKITNHCDLHCKYCHENSDKAGEHANLSDTVQSLKGLPAGTELAIGGGDPLSHPGLIDFLTACKLLGFICSITVNEHHAYHRTTLIEKLIKENLIYGLGLSIINNNNNDNYRIKSVHEKAIKKDLDNYSNIVIHCIAGVHDLSLIMESGRIFDKILILGYKEIGRGKEYKSNEKELIYDNIKELKNNLWRLFNCRGNNKDTGINTISFDNLAIKQLGVREHLSKNEWDRFYMGDDGQFTMYFDAVEKKYAKSSTDSCRWNSDLNKITDVFHVIRKGYWVND